MLSSVNRATTPSVSSSAAELDNSISKPIRRAVRMAVHTALLTGLVPADCTAKNCAVRSRRPVDSTKRTEMLSRDVLIRWVYLPSQHTALRPGSGSAGLPRRSSAAPEGAAATKK